MKKSLIIFALVLVIAVSVAAGTLAMYTTTLENVASGDVVAKEFVLLEAGTNTYEADVKIAPAETVEWTFAVKNFDGAKITETDMALDIEFTIAAASGKAAIAPLTFTVKDQEDEEIGTRTGAGTLNADSSFAADVAATQTYTLVINWPSDDEVDIDYAGAGFGTAVTVKVTGTQQ